MCKYAPHQCVLLVSGESLVMRCLLIIGTHPSDNRMRFRFSNLFQSCCAHPLLFLREIIIAVLHNKWWVVSFISIVFLKYQKHASFHSQCWMFTLWWSPAEAPSSPALFEPPPPCVRMCVRVCVRACVLQCDAWVIQNLTPSFYDAKWTSEFNGFLF